MPSPELRKKALAPILEAPDTMDEVGASIPLSEAVSIEKEKEPPTGTPGVVGVEEGSRLLFQFWKLSQQRSPYP